MDMICIVQRKASNDSFTIPSPGYIIYKNKAHPLQTCFTFYLIWTIHIQETISSIVIRKSAQLSKDLFSLKVTLT